ncbi:hypothetical protein [Candidatus Pelagibacter sp. HIMB1321]|uniref:hypothetical protein n=1 Tax=Candidatus Pelagibacter sp. HIMB1321 TaxID=1388755 RepID=UPI000A0806B8|nr:hypothetical protein [Candidatus Pelagibacter sp. HIMB1321]SMF79924.1 hypothetical protein SAMN02744631_1138 [Candidatus Pelagibacter sp. HIMB1321]
MKILKLLNNKYLSILLLIFLNTFNANAEDKPIDIWNIDENEIEESSISNNQNNLETNNTEISQPSIFDLQSEKEIETVQVSSDLNSQKLKIIGLYDPEDYDLQINMWSNSNGDQLKYLFTNIDKMQLSKDASDLLNIVLLTNSYNPEINITNEEFLNIRSNWLIKNKDRELIEEYLVKNQILNLHPDLSRYLVDQYLSEANIEKACELFLKNSEVINDEYLSKFNLYCLINAGRSEEAQLILDLKKELGFNDEYFEKKLNYLFGYTQDPDPSISETSILDFHLAHRTNPDFIFEPKKNTDSQIWKYLSASNLLFNIEEVDIVEEEKISLIEKATHDKNYSEKDLFALYKRFQFNINQLLNASESYKSLSNIEARALIYQRSLIESDTEKKLEFLKLLKDLFIKDEYSNAFDIELKQALETIEPDNVPSNFTTFYFDNIQEESVELKDIKFNKDILHQSRLVNYFNGDFAKSKIEKDLDNFLKKIKKDKKYILTKKDIMLIESIKSDGIEISKKYEDLYEINESEMPTDIQVMINNNEIGSTVLRIIEVIGQDNLTDLDEDTLYFIISALNQLDIDYIRNKILLKVLPLKV